SDLTRIHLGPTSDRPRTHLRGRSEVRVAVTRWVVATLVVCAACGRAAAPRTEGNLRPGLIPRGNLLLVTIDTLRPHRPGASARPPRAPSAHPHPRPPAPAPPPPAGRRYTQAPAHVPMTLPSHASILTGLAPRHTGVHNNTGYRLDDRVPTLATVLARAGYDTA